MSVVYSREELLAELDGFSAWDAMEYGFKFAVVEGGKFGKVELLIHPDGTQSEFVSDNRHLYAVSTAKLVLEVYERNGSPLPKVQ